MSDETPAAVSDTAPPDPGPVRHSQRQILEKCHTGLTTRYKDVVSTQFLASVTGKGEVLRVTFDNGDIWWLSAIRGDER